MIPILSFSLTAILVAGEDSGAAVALRQMAEVTGNRLQLSDLLPADASAELRAIAGGVGLGRAPQPGSLRILERAQIVRELQRRPRLLLQLRIPERITIRRAGWPISRAAVSEAVAGFLLAQSGNGARMADIAGLQWSGEVSSDEANPAVEGKAAYWDNREQAFAVRLRCAEASYCGSFLVHVPEARAGSAEKDRGAADPAEHAGTATLSGRGGNAHPQSAESAPQREPGLSLAEAGKPAKLMVEGDGFRISMPVVCLERGVLGQKIRALDSSNHRVVWAEVVGAGRLLAIADP
jgi:hypothetical protein